MSEHIGITDQDGVRTVTIQRPEKKNALTLAMYEALAVALEEAETRDNIRAIVITGVDGAFTSGNDLNDFLKAVSIETSPAARFLHAISGARKPVVAAVTGLAVGIGVTLLLHCDLVYVADGARLQLPFVNLGLVPEGASSLLLPRLAGHVRAAELLMLGAPFSAADAVDLGIANRAVPAQDVLALALATAHKLAALPPEALRETKALLKRGAESVNDRFQVEFTAFGARLRSEELRQAVAAFMGRKG